MRIYSFLLLTLLTLFFTGCENAAAVSYDSKCPKCGMEVKESADYSAKLLKGSDAYLFDDIGCLVLWAKENHISLNTNNIEVFTGDTKRYIRAKEAHFGINDKTPMNYGFGAYENDKEGAIKADDVIVRMLRGENMANPKIRKQILGE